MVLVLKSTINCRPSEATFRNVPCSKRKAKDVQKVASNNVLGNCAEVVRKRIRDDMDATGTQEGPEEKRKG